MHTCFLAAGRTYGPWSLPVLHYLPDPRLMTAATSATPLPRLLASANSFSSMPGESGPVVALAPNAPPPPTTTIWFTSIAAEEARLDDIGKCRPPQSLCDASFNGIGYCPADRDAQPGDRGGVARRQGVEEAGGKETSPEEAGTLHHRTSVRSPKPRGRLRRRREAAAWVRRVAGCPSRL